MTLYRTADLVTSGLVRVVEQGPSAVPQLCDSREGEPVCLYQVHGLVSRLLDSHHRGNDGDSKVHGRNRSRSAGVGNLHVSFLPKKRYRLRATTE